MQVRIDETTVFAQAGSTFTVALFDKSIDAAEEALKKALESINKFRALL